MAGGLSSQVRVGFYLPLGGVRGVGEVWLPEEDEEFVYMFSYQLAYHSVILA